MNERIENRPIKLYLPDQKIKLKASDSPLIFTVENIVADIVESWEFGDVMSDHNGLIRDWRRNKLPTTITITAILKEIRFK